MRAHFSAGLATSVICSLAFMYYSGVYYEYNRDLMVPTQIFVKTKCKSLHHLKSSSWFEESGSLRMVFALVNDKNVTESIAKDCEYIQLETDQKPTELKAARYPNDQLQLIDLEAGTNQIRLYPNDILNDKFAYVTKISPKNDVSSILFFAIPSNEERKTYATKGLRLEIFYDDETSPDNKPIAEFLIRLNLGDAAKVAPGNQISYDGPNRKSNFIGPEYKFNGTLPSNAQHPVSRSAVSVDFEYSSPKDERVEFAILTGLAALISAGAGIMIQAMCDRFEERRRRSS